MYTNSLLFVFFTTAVYRQFYSLQLLQDFHAVAYLITD